MRLRIVGNNPHAGGSECIVFGHLDSKSNQFTPVSREPRDLSGRKAGISFQGGWEVSDMRFGAGLAKASALVGRTIGQDSCTTSGRVVLVSHRWSGVIQVNDIGRKYTVDLYSQETRLVLLDIVNEFMVDITDLATTENGELKIPVLDVEGMVDHVRSSVAWFRFLERDADFRPGVVRQTLEWFRRRSSSDAKLHVVSLLLSAIAARIAAPPPATPTPAAMPTMIAPPREDMTPLRDEMRLLAAAVEGLALRAEARA